MHMYLLARNFASQFEGEIKANEEREIFGTAFRYRKVFMEKRKIKRTLQSKNLSLAILRTTSKTLAKYVLILQIL